MRKWRDTPDIERMEVLYDFEDILACALDILPKIKKTHDVCLDSWGPSVVLGTEAVKNAYIAVHNRGAKIRLITEVTSANIVHCKEFMKFARVRHLDKVKGNFSISDTRWYTASAIAEKDKPPPRLIYSTVKEIADQHQYFFETLWNKAIPAEQKIREIEEGIEPPYTIMLALADEIINRMRKRIQNSTELMVCAGAGGLELVYKNLLDDYREALKRKKEGKHKGIRWVMAVTKENLTLVRLFVNEGLQIRHIRNMPPLNFAVDGKALHATIESMEGGIMTGNFLVSTEPAYLDHFRSIFEELWKQGMDAPDRILELEKDIEPASVEVISNPRQSIKRAWDLLKSAKQEVMVMLSSPTAFRRQLEMGGLEVIQEAVKNGAKVKLLIPSDRNVAQTLSQVKLVLPQAEFRAVDASLTTSVTIVLVDHKECLFFELKDDTATDSLQAVGLALYSGSKSIVSSYTAILEAIWKQSELNEQIRQTNEKLEDAYKQLEDHEKVQNEFINVAAHELRTPVQPILGMSELLEAKLKTTAPSLSKAREAAADHESTHRDHDGEEEIKIKKSELAMIVRNAKRLERLSSDILEVARIEGSGVRIKKEEFDIDEVIVPPVEEARKSSQIGANVKVIYRKSQAMNNKKVIVEADKGKITQVIHNLLNNAIKFTEKGVIIVSTRELADQENNKLLEVSVVDTGQGIDPEIEPRLFTKFATKSSSGTGLGLFISRSIIEAHGGRIWGENNKDGKGATFAFTLPLARQY